MFRKPKRNVRQRTVYSDEEEADQDSNSQPVTKEDDSKKKIHSSSLLDFGGFEAESEGEVFRVKKSSQSRKLKKQIKAEKKKMRERPEDDIVFAPPPLPATPFPPPPSAEEDDIGVRLKNNIVVKKAQEPRLLSGYEAEALHMEEEDESEEEEEESKDPLQEILKGGAIPDAAAIYAARKRRQAARERGPEGFIPIKKKEEKPDPDPEQDPDSEEEDRIVMAGVRTNAELRKESFKKIEEEEEEKDDDHDKWEEMQIRKAMRNMTTNNAPMSPNAEESPEAEKVIVRRDGPLVSYNLEGIKDRIKKRVTSLREVHQRHLNDIDKIDQDLIHSQSTILEKQDKLPRVVERHQFYQDLRGYITDLVECFDEKLTKIRFVEDKYIGLKGDMFNKLTLRRREDVRDQMRELSSTNSKPLLNTAEDNNEEWLRQRRAAEREGRRRRRAQLRLGKVGQAPPHNEGMSSDDELSSHDQATIAKSRQDIENQARTIMVDVVEDFSSLDGILSRMQEWKLIDATAYNEAFAFLCLPKMVTPLVTLQLLFWNPLEDHAQLEDMEWYQTLALYCHSNASPEEDQLLSLVIEKVVLVKVNNMAKAAYDPLSTCQTLRLTQLLSKMRTTYPTLTGTSKQVREVLASVLDKIKACVDNDLYIPLGYSKQFLENPQSGHSVFLNRQFWGCFKLFKNILLWHGLLADGVLMEHALNSILYRYLIIGLGVSNSNPVECVSKCRHIVSVIPSEWRTQLGRFVKYLSALGATPGLSREAVKEVVVMLKTLGATSECETLERTRLL